MNTFCILVRKTTAKLNLSLQAQNRKPGYQNTQSHIKRYATLSVNELTVLSLNINHLTNHVNAKAQYILDITGELSANRISFLQYWTYNANSLRWQNFQNSQVNHITELCYIFFTSLKFKILFDYDSFIWTIYISFILQSQDFECSEWNIPLQCKQGFNTGTQYLPSDFEFSIKLLIWWQPNGLLTFIDKWYHLIRRVIQ